MTKDSRDNVLHILANADCDYATEKDLLQCYYSNSHGYYSSLSDDELLEEINQLQKLKDNSNV
jgi:hypothetical protein